MKLNLFPFTLKIVYKQSHLHINQTLIRVMETLT